MTTENQKVKVSYPDGKGGHETTLKELREKWESHGEGKEWIDRFFYMLDVDGVAYSRVGTYELKHSQNENRNHKKHC